MSYIAVADNVDEELLKVLVDSACLLVASKAREVVLSALGFIKTILLSFISNFSPFLSHVVSFVSVNLLHCYLQQQSGLRSRYCLPCGPKTAPLKLADKLC